MTLEAVYWLVLAVGLGMLVLALVVGDLFDFLDFDLPGTDVSVAPVFFAATAAFGAGGLLGLQAFDLSDGGSLLSGLGTGAVVGALTAALFAALRRQEATGGFDKGQLVGVRGRCTVALAPGRVGRVTVRHEGMSRSFAATAAEAIAVGEEIVVEDVIGGSLTVAPARGRAAAEQPPADA
ncbi:MAG TPA: hypothetical protein VHJ34_00650 [Actinomycetota bacterium]|nr:hypothetical protein [Actinomycetota bacterium]